MKKLLILIFLNVLLFSCYNDFENDGDSINIDMNIILKNRNIISDSAPDLSLIDLYYLKNYSKYDVFECSTVDSNEPYIAGYFDEKTLEFLDNLELVSSLDITWYISGINNYLGLYQIAAHNNLIDTNKYKIIYKIFDINQMPMEYENLSLAFVIKKDFFEAVSLSNGDEMMLDLYSNVEFNIKENMCIITENSFTSKSFLMACCEIEEYYIAEELQHTSVEIEEYENIKCIHENCNAIIDNSQKGTEYFNIVKNCIISTNKSLAEGELLIYDYNKIKDILF